MGTICGNRGEHLLQHGRQNRPLTRVERRQCLAQDSAAGVQDPCRRSSPPVSKDHRDRAMIVSCPPFRLALSDELINDPHRGGLRPGQLPFQLLDAKARILRKNCQPGGQRAGMPGRCLHS